MPGTGNKGPGALSRFPTSSQPQSGDLKYIADQQVDWSHNIEAQVLSTTASRFPLVVSWDLLRNTAISDPTYAALLHAATHDGDDELWETKLAEYKRYKNDFLSLDGVVTYKGRPVIPQHLRQQVLTALHRAHQGKTGMGLAAQDAVWWPGYTKDIVETRSQCSACNRNAP